MEARDHINVIELKAAFLATKASDRSNITVCLRMDNTSAVAHVNNKGGTRSPQLVNLTLELCKWCLQKSILITAQHLPGKLNNAADRESRVLRLQGMANRPTSDSALPKVQCRSLCVTPNGSPPNLCQLETRSGCYLHRCNDFDWSLLKGFAFPPFSLIAPVLKNIYQDQPS